MNENRVLTENLLVAACAISAGVHVALAPAHVRESTITGAGFALAAVLLIAVAVAVTADAWSGRFTARSAAVLLAGLIGAYGISRSVGLPFGDEGVERVDVIGAVTEVVQLAGLGAALLLRRESTT